MTGNAPLKKWTENPLSKTSSQCSSKASAVKTSSPFRDYPLLTFLKNISSLKPSSSLYSPSSLWFLSRVFSLKLTSPKISTPYGQKHHHLCQDPSNKMSLKTSSSIRYPFCSNKILSPVLSLTPLSCFSPKLKPKSSKKISQPFQNILTFLRASLSATPSETLWKTLSSPKKLSCSCQRTSSPRKQKAHLKKISPNRKYTPLWFSLTGVKFPLHLKKARLILWQPSTKWHMAAGIVLHLARSMTCRKWKKGAPYGGLQLHNPNMYMYPNCIIK